MKCQHQPSAAESRRWPGVARRGLRFRIRVGGTKVGERGAEDECEGNHRECGNQRKAQQPHIGPTPARRVQFRVLCSPPASTATRWELALAVDDCHSETRVESAPAIDEVPGENVVAASSFNVIVLTLTLTLDLVVLAVADERVVTERA